MLSRFTQRLIGASLAASALSFAGAASADTVELSYLMPFVGISFDYRGMGYSDADGNFVDLAGNNIVSSRVVVDFTPAAGVDITTFHMNMVVPVLNATSQFFSVQGTDLIESSPGHYTFSLTSNDYNGEIYSGRFSIESYGLDADGNPIRMAGVLGDTTGFYYTVDAPAAAVPEPESAAMLLAGLALVPVLARRRRASAKATA